jgi:hypothetical protein
MEVSGQIHAPAALPRSDIWYPLDRKLGEPQSRSRRCGEKKNSQLLSGFEPRIIQPVVQHYIAELSRHPQWSSVFKNAVSLSHHW